ncbi:MmgE/PrpD family protein [Haloarculaceae archaeon H-GB2-1]|nr:MmgE/PrpD family protein [Haloarculaceae archaeon H-GB2-1]
MGDGWSSQRHTGPPILALAAEEDATGRDLVTAFAAGFELECTLAAPISPDHYEDGWHATATFGALGATAAAASLRNLTTDETVHALNTAASTPAGLKRNFGSMTKPLHAGLCARSGVTAARLAYEGFTADPTAISGERGFWDLYGPEARDDFTFDPKVWALQEHGIHVKYYPCCYFTHTSIAGTASLVDDHDIDPQNIERIHVRVAQGAADALHHADPDTGLEAKFSMEYTVASAAVRDRVGLTAFDDDSIDDPVVQQVRECVDFDVDDDLHYDSHEANVNIDTAEDSYERLQENPPGTHDNPLTDAELRSKFDECARRAVTEETADALAAIFTDLADCDDIAAAVSDAAHP